MPLGSLRNLALNVDVRTRGAAKALRRVNGHGEMVAQSLQQVYWNADLLQGQVRDLTFALGAAAVTAGVLTAALVKIAQSGMRVERTFAEVQATSGATAKQMEEITAQAEYLGARLPVTLDQAARAFREMTFAGFSAQEAIEASTAAVQLAVTGGLQMEQAARTMTSTLNAFRMEADQATQVVNAMSSVFASSAVNIEEIGHSLEYASAAAYQADQTVTDVTAALGALGDVGLRASKAGTGMQQIFARIADPANRATEAMRKIGVAQEDFLDEEGNFLSMYQIMGKLNQATQGLPSAERMEALTAIFRARGARAAAPLIANYDEIGDKMEQIAAASAGASIKELADLTEDEVAQANENLVELGSEFRVDPELGTEGVLRQLQSIGQDTDLETLTTEVELGLGLDQQSAEILARSIQQTDDIEELTEAVNDSTDAAELAEAQIDTVSGSLQYFAGSLSSAAFQAYNVFQPALLWLLMRLRTLTDVIVDNPIFSRAFGVALIAAAGAAIALTVALGATVAQIMWLRVASGQMVGATYGYVAATYIAQAATGAYRGAIWLLTADIAGLRAGYAALNAQLYLTQQRILMEMWAKYASTRASTTLTGATLALIKAQFGATSSTLSTAASMGVMSGSAYLASTAVQFLNNSLRTMWALLGPVGWAIVGLVALIALWQAGLGDWLNITDDVNDAIEWLSESLAYLWNVIKDVVEITGLLGKLAIVGSLYAIYKAVEMVVGQLRRLYDWYLSLALIGKVILLPLGILFLIPYLLGLIYDAGKKLVGFLKGAFAEAWDVAAAKLGVFITTLKLVHKYFTTSGNIIDRTFGRIGTAISDFNQSISDTGAAIKDFFDLLQSNPIEALRVAFEKLGTTLPHLDFLNLIGQLFGMDALGDMLYERGVEAIQSFVNGLLAIPGNLFDGFVDYVVSLFDVPTLDLTGTLFNFEGLGQLFYERGKDAIEALADGIRDSPGMLREAFTGVLGTILPFMPSSDADQGPLSNLTAWGHAIPETLVNGILSGGGLLTSAIGSILSNIPGAGMLLGAAGGIVDGVLGGGGPGAGPGGGPLDGGLPALDQPLPVRIVDAPLQQPVATGEAGPDTVEGDEERIALTINQNINNDINGMDPEDVAQQIEQTIPGSQDILADLERELKRNQTFFG